MRQAVLGASAKAQWTDGAATLAGDVAGNSKNMILENNIGWCDDTGNKVTGCQKVCPECDNCYAESGTRARVLRAQGIETWGTNGARHPVGDFSKKVRRLNKSCICDSCHMLWPYHHLDGRQCPRMEYGCVGRLRRIRFFADSNSDWLDNKWPIETSADLLKDIHDCPNIDFQLLTKRPENWEKRVRSAWNYYKGESSMWRFISDWLGGGAKRIPQNVWIGASLRNGDIPKAFYDIPAAIRFVSAEPLLAEADLSDFLYEFGCKPHCGDKCSQDADCPVNTRPNSWVIVGAESGSQRRDCGVDAICDVARQCQLAGVPVYVKQDCAFKSGQKGRIPDDIWALKQFPSVAAAVGA